MYMVQVDVTLADIEQGVRKNTRQCPIALAMLRALEGIEPKRYEVVIANDIFGVLDKKKDQVYEYVTPRDATDFIFKFDRSEPVEPFKFEFDLTTGNPFNRGMHHFTGFNAMSVYHIPFPKYAFAYFDSVSDFAVEKPVKPIKKYPYLMGPSKEAEFKVPLQYKPTVPVKYKKIINLEKDIQDHKEVLEPTIKELEEFISKYELSNDFALVTISK